MTESDDTVTTISHSATLLEDGSQMDVKTKHPAGRRSCFLENWLQVKKQDDLYQVQQFYTDDGGSTHQLIQMRFRQEELSYAVYENVEEKPNSIFESDEFLSDGFVTSVTLKDGGHGHERWEGIGIRHMSLSLAAKGGAIFWRGESFHEKQRKLQLLGPGRSGGYLSDLFSRAGYHLIFINGSPVTIDKLNEQGYYTLFTAKADGLDKRRIEGFEAYSSKRDFDVCVERLQKVDLIAVALYPGAYPQ